MKCFRIRLNGEIICTIGQPDASILMTNVALSQGNTERGVEDYIRLNMSGVSQDTDLGYPEHFRWKQEDLGVGDRIDIEILESSTVDAPLRRYSSDKNVQENPFADEEWREMRYQDYLKLKAEFER